MKLTFEELTTVLTQIEACLNSCPLTPLPDAEDSPKVLTPGHLLIGHPHLSPFPSINVGVFVNRLFNTSRGAGLHVHRCSNGCGRAQSLHQ